jgi:glycosyltransferase involved in cell wall biosynthesis
MITVLYPTLYPTLGGAEKALLQLLSGLDRRRVSPLVVVPAEGPLTAALRERDVETVVEPFPTPPLPGLLRPAMLRAFLHARSALCALARRRRVTIVHCGDLLALMLLRPLLHEGVGLLYQVNYLGGRARQLALRPLAEAKRRAVVAWSQDQREAVCAAVPALAAATVVVYPGVVPEELEGGDGPAFRREIGVPQGSPLVGMLARFDAWKGHAVFLQAARRVLDARPDVRFAVVGGGLNSAWLPHVGRYESEVRDETQRLRLLDALAFVPHRADVDAVFAALDLVVCPSVREPFGMVVIEAMSAGRPVVASDSGGPAEILDHGRTGLLFRTGDPKALADAITGLLDDAGQRASLGTAARAEVARRFHRVRYAAEIQEIYDRLA